MVLFDEELVLGLGFWFKEWPFQTLESGPKQQKNGQKSLFEGRKRLPGWLNGVCWKGIWYIKVALEFCSGLRSAILDDPKMVKKFQNAKTIFTDQIFT